MNPLGSSASTSFHRNPWSAKYEECGWTHLDGPSSTSTATTATPTTATTSATAATSGQDYEGSIEMVPECHLVSITPSYLFDIDR